MLRDGKRWKEMESSVWISGVPRRDETLQNWNHETRRDGKTRFSKNRDVRRDARRLVSFSSRDLETKPRLVSWHYIQKIRVFWCWRIWSFHVFLRFFGRFLVKNSLNLRRDLETRRVSSRAVSVRWSQMRRDWKFQKPRRETRPRRLEISRRSDRDLARLQTLLNELATNQTVFWEDDSLTK